MPDEDLSLEAVAAMLRDMADRLERKPKAPRRERRPRKMTRPDGSADPAVASQAERILRDRGFR